MEHLANTFQPHPRQTADEYLPRTDNRDETQLKPVTQKKIANEIAKNLSSKKAPGYDLIIGQVMKELPGKGITKLTHLINKTTFRLHYAPIQ